MRFTFETDYHQKALPVMARCIRKTVRRSKSKRSHIFGWLVVALALLLSLSSGEEAFAITAHPGQSIKEQFRRYLQPPELFAERKGVFEK